MARRESESLPNAIAANQKPPMYAGKTDDDQQHDYLTG
jgi:hypothetical protein